MAPEGMSSLNWGRPRESNLRSHDEKTGEFSDFCDYIGLNPIGISFFRLLDKSYFIPIYKKIFRNTKNYI
jgi:hypothetical protein